MPIKAILILHIGPGLNYSTGLQEIGAAARPLRPGRPVSSYRRR